MVALFSGVYRPDELFRRLASVIKVDLADPQRIFAGCGMVLTQAGARQIFITSALNTRLDAVLDFLNRRNLMSYKIRPLTP